MPQYDLKGKVTLITGASKGIGRALTLALHQAGARIAGCALEADELRNLREALPGSYFAAVDITDYPAFAKFFQSVSERLGVPDIVIANAGVTDQTHHSLADLPVEVWRKVIEVNLTGTFITLKTVLPPMAAAGHGNIIVVTSLLGQKGYGQAHDGPYCASKFGIEGLVEVAVDEYSEQYGLNINTVFPAAMVDTGFFATWSAADRAKLAPPDVLNELVLYLSTQPPFSLTGQSINGKRWNTENDYRRNLLSTVSKTRKDD
ncbi:MAG: SDR family NAD(P)-dependent oxidoreductase [Firmicutes bacterium]|nr:SDR family NAD(P)-dependent oxidoreductase [Bacillota bacterium]